MPVELPAIEGPHLADVLAQPQAIRETAAALAPSPALTGLLDRLRAGGFDRVILTGMGSSQHALHPLALALIDAGHTAVTVETAELVHHQRRLIGPGALVIAASQSGRSAETLRLVELARAAPARAPLLGVTNTPDSPLAREADAVVITRAGDEFSVSCKTYVAALAALHWLASIAAGGGGDPTAPAADLERAATEAGAYLASWRDHVGELAGLLVDTRRLFLLGRGASLAAAEMGALIIKESAKLHAEGMSSAAFRHGPLELVGPGTTTLVFEGAPATAELNRRLARDAAALGGATALVGECAELRALRVAPATEALRPIAEALAVQMVSLALAALAGREPGRFDKAAKVTALE